MMAPHDDVELRDQRTMALMAAMLEAGDQANGVQYEPERYAERARELWNAVIDVAFPEDEEGPDAGDR